MRFACFLSDGFTNMARKLAKCTCVHCIDKNSTRLVSHPKCDPTKNGHILMKWSALEIKVLRKWQWYISTTTYYILTAFENSSKFHNYYYCYYFQLNMCKKENHFLLSFLTNNFSSFSQEWQYTVADLIRERYTYWFFISTQIC